MRKYSVVPFKKVERKVVQMVSMATTIDAMTVKIPMALCNDGTMWEYNHKTKDWLPIIGIPSMTETKTEYDKAGEARI